jgi:predicted amidohydrolase
MEITIALAQMAISLGRPEENFQAAQSLATKAVAQGADLLVLPELWATGYDLDRAREYAAPLDKGHFALMADLAQMHGQYVAGTALEDNPGGRPFNTAALYGPDGRCLGAYRKVHLWAPLGEVEHMTPGDALPVFELPWGTVAMAICYDLRFPELFRSLVAKGADLIFLPAAFTLATGRDHWEVLLRARAIENQAYVVAPAQWGRHSPGRRSYGRSLIVDPWGVVLAQAPDQEGVILAELDHARLSRLRREMPCWQHRRLC